MVVLTIWNSNLEIKPLLMKWIYKLTPGRKPVLTAIVIW